MKLNDFFTVSSSYEPSTLLGDGECSPITCSGMLSNRMLFNGALLTILLPLEFLILHGLLKSLIFSSSIDDVMSR
jgi:hypothetical protein